MSTRLYYAEIAPGDAVLSKTEIRFRSGDGIRTLPEGSRGTVSSVDGIDAMVIFADAPDVLLRIGRWELRRAR